MVQHLVEQDVDFILPGYLERVLVIGEMELRLEWEIEEGKETRFLE